MERNPQDPLPKRFTLNEPELDLYPIPAYSSSLSLSLSVCLVLPCCSGWFSWYDIHEKEKDSLGEFFDGNSIARTPRIYKEYRDFIINKYREDVTRRLTFTEVRRSLVGDVNLVHRVFRCLEKWGLINFFADRPQTRGFAEESHEIKEEGGVPDGVRVSTFPHTLRRESARCTDGVAFKMPSLASYSDVFEDGLKQNDSGCSNCHDPFHSAGHYQCEKGMLSLCTQCFDTSQYGEGYSREDFKPVDPGKTGAASSGGRWTDGEDLLLLECISKHGEDWELIAQNVKSKSKLECISRSMELPLGDLLFDSFEKDLSGMPARSETSSLPVKTESNPQGCGECETEGVAAAPPQKRKFSVLLSDATDSLMKQVSKIASVCPAEVNAAANEASARALCEENPCAAVLHDLKMNEIQPQHFSPRSWEDSSGAPMLKIRSAICSALGVAAAHSKLLADEEVVQMEVQVAAVIETQLKKMHTKMKKLEALRSAMDEEYIRIKQLKEELAARRIVLLRESLASKPPPTLPHLA